MQRARLTLLVLAVVAASCERPPAAPASAPAARSPSAEAPSAARESAAPPTSAPAHTQPTLSDVARQATETVEVAGDWLAEQKRQFIATAEDEVRRAEAQLQSLRERLTDASEKIRPALQRRVDDLTRHTESLHNEIKKAQDAAPELWDAMKQRVENSLRRMRDVAAPNRTATQPSTAPAGDRP